VVLKSNAWNCDVIRMVEKADGEYVAKVKDNDEQQNPVTSTDS